MDEPRNFVSPCGPRRRARDAALGPRAIDATPSNVAGKTQQCLGTCCWAPARRSLESAKSLAMC
eukprot:7818283-Lingulodinium_polyedra.AAC.1